MLTVSGRRLLPLAPPGIHYNGRSAGYDRGGPLPSQPQEKIAKMSVAAGKFTGVRCANRAGVCENPVSPSKNPRLGNP
jgi:hypothetical protein